VRAGSTHMTTVVVVALVAAAAVGLLIGFVVWHGGSPAGSSIAEKDRYLQSARNALADARRLALDLEHVDRVAELDADDLRSLTTRIDVLSSQVTQVTCLAPTAMDGRVSRSVAVSARSISDVLRGERDSRADPEGSVRRSADEFVQRRTEFSLAVRDLENHVELL
jgi:hypothetical protein